MELSATLFALNYCAENFEKNKIDSIQVYTDSVYVIKGITLWIIGWKKRGWKNAANEEVANQDLWEVLDSAVIRVKNQLGASIKWSFVKGHSGIAGNERCDEIAVAYSKNNYVELYDGKAEEYFFDALEAPVTRELPDINKKTSGSPKTFWYLSYINGVLTQHKTWKECEAVVKGRAAKFKKVSSAEEELTVKKSWGIK
jgi:ribonuclease HI